MPGTVEETAVNNTKQGAPQGAFNQRRGDTINNDRLWQLLMAVQKEIRQRRGREEQGLWRSFLKAYVKGCLTPESSFLLPDTAAVGRGLHTRT